MIASGVSRATRFNLEAKALGDKKFAADAADIKLEEVITGRQEPALTGIE